MRRRAVFAALLLAAVAALGALLWQQPQPTPEPDPARIDGGAPAGLFVALLDGGAPASQFDTLINGGQP